MINQYINFDLLSQIMLIVVWFIGLVVSKYSISYMNLDRNYTLFMARLAVLLISLSTVFLSNNIIILALAWFLSNFLLARLVGHNQLWVEARASENLTLQYLASGSLFLALGMLALAVSAGTFQINLILANTGNVSPVILMFSTCCLFVSVMLQAGLWPFHSWLISSLNSPTPVSALMHAGLVNGGGYLLIRFSPLFMSSPIIMDVLFVAGCVSAILGTAMKLVLSDVKRQLACSTVGQMGFMVMLVGVGLFKLALLHLVWHALFKANLFLKANSTLSEYKYHDDHRLLLQNIVVSFAVALAGIILFYMGLQQKIEMNSWLIPGLIWGCVVCQLAYSLKPSTVYIKIPVLIAILAFSWIYGWYVNKFEAILQINELSSPLTLDYVHISSIVILAILWLVFLFRRNLFVSRLGQHVQNMIYVGLLNLSQPNHKTVTTCRLNYRF